MNDLAPSGLSLAEGDEGWRPIALSPLRRACDLVAGGDEAIVSASITILLDRSPGAAMALYRDAKMLATEFGVQAAVHVLAAAKSARVEFRRRR